LWADSRLLEALPVGNAHAANPVDPAVLAIALREYGHVLGAEEIWLARLEGRTPRTAVWPDLSRAEVAELRSRTEAHYRSYLGTLAEGDLDAAVTYVNSAGQAFTNRVGEILFHVALHGQYHRGKVNLLLRQAGLAPAPTDYIAFVRGAPAATTERSGPGAGPLG
jgi:uncharacterized damage-inducible protein DinB